MATTNFKRTGSNAEVKMNKHTTPTAPSPSSPSRFASSSPHNEQSDKGVNPSYAAMKEATPPTCPYRKGSDLPVGPAWQASATEQDIAHVKSGDSQKSNFVAPKSSPKTSLEHLFDDLQELSEQDTNYVAGVAVNQPSPTLSLLHDQKAVEIPDAGDNKLHVDKYKHESTIHSVPLNKDLKDCDSVAQEQPAVFAGSKRKREGETRAAEEAIKEKAAKRSKTVPKKGLMNGKLMKSFKQTMETAKLIKPAKKVSTTSYTTEAAVSSTSNVRTELNTDLPGRSAVFNLRRALALKEETQSEKCVPSENKATHVTTDDGRRLLVFKMGSEEQWINTAYGHSKATLAQITASPHLYPNIEIDWKAKTATVELMKSEEIMELINFRQAKDKVSRTNKKSSPKGRQTTKQKSRSKRLPLPRLAKTSSLGQMLLLLLSAAQPRPTSVPSRQNSLLATLQRINGLSPLGHHV